MHFQDKATTSPGAPNHTPTPHFISVSRIFFLTCFKNRCITRENKLLDTKQSNATFALIGTAKHCHCVH